MSYRNNTMSFRRNIKNDILGDWISKEELFQKADSKILWECGSLIRNKFGEKYYRDLERKVNSKNGRNPEKNEVKPKKRDILMDIYNNKMTSEELINLAPKEALEFDLFLRNKFGDEFFEALKKKIEENSNDKPQNLKPQKRDILMDIYNNKITPEELINLAPKEALEYELLIRNKFGNDCFEKIKNKINKK